MEETRLKPYMRQGIVEAGIDEVGRGCLAGPVVAAAVVLPEDFDFPIVKDSKQLNERERKEAFDIITEHAIAYGIGWKTAKDVDTINILQATFAAMHSAVNKMQYDYSIKCDHLLIDGNRFNGYGATHHTCVVKGDATYYSIAAASILAKVVRDEWMKKQALNYPNYGWETNAGYGTKKHREAILEYGTTEQHRMSFLGNILPKEKNNLF